MARKRVTSAEVAALARVSQSAVSRVFTPGASASKETIARVREAAAKLGYRPSTLARAMVSGRSRIIGVVVANFGNQFYPVAFELLSNALEARGYHVLVFTSQDSIDGVDAVIQGLMDYQVDGIVAASVSIGSDLAARARSTGVPVVLLNRGQDDAGFSNITTDNVLGGRRVAEFLLAGGHERIAHISGWQGSSTGRDRQAGFIAALNEAGVTPFAVVDARYDRELAISCARSLLAGPERPDAIFVGNDYTAFGVIDAVREAGLVPGRDVSVVGFDDVPIAGWAAYDLTTYRQPVNRMIEAAVEALVDQIETRVARPRQIAFEGRLVLRGSARIPQGWQE